MSIFDLHGEICLPWDNEKEGDVCRNCGIGVMKLSTRGNLYCDKLCWVKKTVTNN